MQEGDLLSAHALRSARAGQHGTIRLHAPSGNELALRDGRRPAGRHDAGRESLRRGDDVRRKAGFTGRFRTWYAISCACPALRNGTPALATSFGSIGRRNKRRTARRETARNPARTPRAMRGSSAGVMLPRVTASRMVAGMCRQSSTVRNRGQVDPEPLTRDEVALDSPLEEAVSSEPVFCAERAGVARVALLATRSSCAIRGKLACEDKLSRAAADDDCLPVIIPTNDEAVVPISPERVRRLRKHLVATLRALRAMKDPERSVSPLR